MERCRRQRYVALGFVLKQENKNGSFCRTRTQDDSCNAIPRTVLLPERLLDLFVFLSTNHVLSEYSPSRRVFRSTRSRKWTLDTARYGKNWHLRLLANSILVAALSVRLMLHFEPRRKIATAVENILVAGHLRGSTQGYRSNQGQLQKLFTTHIPVIMCFCALLTKQHADSLMKCRPDNNPTFEEAFA
jgi:hypothetical protein